MQNKIKIVLKERIESARDPSNFKEQQLIEIVWTKLVPKECWNVTNQWLKSKVSKGFSRSFDATSKKIEVLERRIK